MVYDDVRNSAYASALKKYVNANSVVLDLGSGLGIHGLIAAAQGARHVYLVEPSPVSIVAAKIAAENGLADKVTCVQKKIEEAELPEEVDIIVSVFTGNFLLEEDLLPSLFFARDRYLKPSGVLLPDRAEMQVVPVSAAPYHQKYIGQWSTPSQGIAFTSVRSYAANSLHYDGAQSREAIFLSEPETLLDLDFASADKAECSNEVTFEVTTPGECHGFLGWFRMRLGDEWLSTSPKAPAMHWSQVFLPLDPPIDLVRGDLISFHLRRPEFGEWTWTCVHNGSFQRHSTFLSQALATDQLRHLARSHSISLNVKGELAKFVIKLMDGTNTVEAIGRYALDEFGDEFSSHAEMNQQLQSILASYGK